MTWGALKEEIVTSLMEQGVGSDMPTADQLLDKCGSIAKFVCLRMRNALAREGACERIEPYGDMEEFMKEPIPVGWRDQ